MEKLYIKRLYKDSTIPTKGSKEAAGYDLYTYFEESNLVIQPFNSLLVCTGISMKIPYGYYGRIAPRSGFSVRTGLIVNAGVIDSDYRGEIKILFQNPTEKCIYIHKNEKVAQIIIEKIAHCELIEVADLDATDRGENGFGSTDSCYMG